MFQRPPFNTYVSRRFAAQDQRPIFKTNATDVFQVRKCEPLISRFQLQRLPYLFPTANHQYRLDPEYEPEDELGNVKEPINKEKVAVALLFKSYRDAGLLRASETGLQFFWVARHSKTVELTAGSGILVAGRQQEDLGSISMRVGITGHQRLDDPTAWPWVADAIRSELAILPPPLVAITSLAIGADQLFANLILERGGSIHAVLPYREIERSFSPEDLPLFRKLASQAELEILNTPGTDQDAYLAAGLRVVDLSDLLIAVWNGLPAVGKGGTSDVVTYALRKGIRLLHIEPVGRTVSILRTNTTTIDNPGRQL